MNRSRPPRSPSRVGSSRRSSFPIPTLSQRKRPSPRLRQPSPRSGGGRARRFARPAAAALVAGISLYLLLPSLAAVFSSWRSLSQLTWYWVGPALLAECGSFVSIWQLDRIALRTASWFAVASAQLAGNAVGRVLPGGGATATAFSVGMLRRTGVDVGDATAAFGAATALQIATTLALPLFALPAIVGGTAVPRSLASAAYLGLAVLLVLVAGGVKGVKSAFTQAAAL